MTQEESEFTPEPISKLEVGLEVVRGIGLTLEQALLWGMEVVRNSLFRLLDRLNFQPRTRKASAFPPGRPRRKTVKQARA